MKIKYEIPLRLQEKSFLNISKYTSSNSPENLRRYGRQF